MQTLANLNICIEISKALKIVGMFILILKIIVPIILIIRGTLNAFSVLTKGDSKQAKESFLSFTLDVKVPLLALKKQEPIKLIVH